MNEVKLSFKCAILLAFTLAFLLASWYLAMALPPDDPIGFAQDHILVKFSPGADVAKIHTANNTRSARVIPGIQVHVVSIPPGQAVKGMLEKFRKNPNVEYAESDFIARATLVPNDNYFYTQWGMNNTGQYGGTPDADIDAPEAWDITTGSASVKIAILDTGIAQSHSDVSGKVVDSQNFTTSPSKYDNYGHGTHVAGIASAFTNNATGVAGVGFDCSLMNIKVLDDNGSGYYSWITEGIIYAANKGAEVINMSLGGWFPSSALRDAVNYAWGKGVVLVAAAGNDGSKLRNFPAYYSNCIAVAATDFNDNKAYFSNYGAWVDVAAPGVNIYSTTLSDSYGSMSGTSMASPHVAGLAGLVWSSPYGTSNTSVRERIESTAEPIPGTGTYWTWGRVNAYNAVYDDTSFTDIAITSVSAPSSVVQGDPVNVIVTVENVGNQNVGSFNVTLKDETDNTTGTKSIDSLSAGKSTELTFVCDTSGASIGVHKLTASHDLTDDNASNDSSSTWVTVTEQPANNNMYASVSVNYDFRTAGKKNIFVWGVATVTIVDGNDDPVEGATVYGSWSGSTSDSDVGVTDSLGQVIFTSDNLKNPESGEFIFTVDNVTKTGWNYESPTPKPSDSISYP